MSSSRSAQHGPAVARPVTCWPGYQAHPVDIDHTLIEAGGVGNEISRDAFGQVTGHKINQMADVTGRTEPARRSVGLTGALRIRVDKSRYLKTVG